MVKVNDSRYVRVTSAPTNWAADNENEYLVVYETTPNTTGNVMNGRGSGWENITTLQPELTGITISHDEVEEEYYIQGNDLIDSCSFIIEKSEGEYYIKTSLWERYIAKNSKNNLSQSNIAPIPHTISWSSPHPILQCTYQSSNYRLGYKTTGIFGYYTTSDAERQNIWLYRKKNYFYDSEIYFANEEVYVGVGDYNTEAVHTASGYNGTITYMSLNTDVATVNPSTGEVTALKQGEAIIVATGTATKTYYGGSAQYTLRVSAGGTAFTTEMKAIVAEYEGRYYAMKNTINDDGSADAIEVRVIHEGGSHIVVTPNVDELAWNISGNTSTGYSIQSDATGKYLSPTTTSSDAKLNVVNAPYYWQWSNNLNGRGDEGPYSQYSTSPKRTFLCQNGRNFKNYSVENIGYRQVTTLYSDVPTYHGMRYAYLMYPANGEAETYVCTNADPVMKGTDGKQNYVATLKVASVDESRVGSAIPLFLNAKNTIINGTAQELDITDKVDFYAPAALFPTNLSMAAA